MIIRYDNFKSDRAGLKSYPKQGYVLRTSNESPEGTIPCIAWGFNPARLWIQYDKPISDRTPPSDEGGQIRKYKKSPAFLRGLKIWSLIANQKTGSFLWGRPLWVSYISLFLLNKSPLNPLFDKEGTFPVCFPPPFQGGG